LTSGDQRLLHDRRIDRKTRIEGSVVLRESGGARLLLHAVGEHTRGIRETPRSITTIARTTIHSLSGSIPGRHLTVGAEADSSGVRDVRLRRLEVQETIIIGLYAEDQEVLRGNPTLVATATGLQHLSSDVVQIVHLPDETPTRSSGGRIAIVALVPAHAPRGFTHRPLDSSTGPTHLFHPVLLLILTYRQYADAGPVQSNPGIARTVHTEHPSHPTEDLNEADLLFHIKITQKDRALNHAGGDLAASSQGRVFEDRTILESQELTATENEKEGLSEEFLHHRRPRESIINLIADESPLSLLFVEPPENQI
jgi:hypothetical protein